MGCVYDSEDAPYVVIVVGGCLKLSAYVNYGMLTVHVMQAKHLRSGLTNRCNTSVTVSLEPDSVQQTQCKTRVVEDSNQPLIDEKFSYELLEDDFRKRLMVCVLNTSPHLADGGELLGCMSFGLRHIMTKKTEVNGWYFLLSEELGQRKHLKAAISRHHHTKPLHTASSVNTMDMSQAAETTFMAEAEVSFLTSRRGNQSMMSFRGAGPDDSLACRMDRSVLSRTANTSYMVNTSFASDATCLNQSVRASHRQRRQYRNRMSGAASEYSDMGRPAEVSYVERKKEVSFMLPPESEHSQKSILKKTSSSAMGTSHRARSRSRSKLEDLENVWMDTVTVVMKQTSGSIGFTITGENPAQVCSVQPGGVAEKSGLKQDDYIMGINGLCVSNGTTQTVANVIRHCKTSKLVVDVQRPKPIGRPQSTASRLPAVGGISAAPPLPASVAPPPGEMMPAPPVPALHGLKRKAAHSSTSSLQRTGQKLRHLLNRSSSFLKIR